MRRPFVALAFALTPLPLVACLPDPSPYVCAIDSDCAPGLGCSDQQCVTPTPPPDAPEAPPDAPDGPDAPFVREVCLIGPAMPLGRDACVDAVCAADASCCTLGWAEPCVQAAARTCEPLAGATSPGRCPSDVSVMGWDTMNTLRFRPDPANPRAVHCQPALGPTHLFTASAAWADVEGDGDVDLAIGSLGGVRVLQGNGVTGGVLDLASPPSLEVVDPTPHDPTAWAWGSRVAWGDADHDGDLDLLWYDEIAGLRVFRREPGPPATYQPTWLITGAEITAPRPAVSVAWMQLDADLDLEVVALHRGRFRFFDRQPDDAWLATDGPATSDGGFVATFDRLVTVGGQVYRAGTLSLSAGPSLGFNAARGLTWGDLDGNGALDVVVGRHMDMLWAPGSTSGGFEPLVTLAASPDPQPPVGVFGVAIADLDGDRRLDVLGSSYGGPPVVRLQRANRSFDAPVLTVKPGKVEAQAVTLAGVEPLSTSLCD